MNLPCLISFYSVIFITFFSLSGCLGVKKINFDTPVDTKTKRILFQEKKTFELIKNGVFANNAFDGARLNGFEYVNDSTARVIIRPENTPINNSAYYAFQTWSNEPKEFYFVFDYPIKYKHRYIPKIKQNGVWKVMDTINVYKQDTQVTVKLNLSTSPIIVAAQEVQDSKKVEHWYSNLSIGKESYVHVKNFGKSVLGKNMPVLDIYKGDKINKDIIVLLTRQHPPEVTGYYAFQEFLTTILNESQLADKFLNKYRVLAFPIMNPDGVDLGHWRHNAGGVDLNRDWSKYKQKEIKQAVKFITKEKKKNNSKIILGLDFHSTYEDVFYTNKIRNNTTLPHFIDNWFAALETNIEGYKVNEVPGKSSKPVSKGWFLYGHNAVGITYEIGDSTPKDRILKISQVSAIQMMKLLTNDRIIK